jgi:hypothetical protein
LGAVNLGSPSGKPRYVVRDYHLQAFDRENAAGSAPKKVRKRALKVFEFYAD